MRQTDYYESSFKLTLDDWDSLINKCRHTDINMCLFSLFVFLSKLTLFGQAIDKVLPSDQALAIRKIGTRLDASIG